MITPPVGFTQWFCASVVQLFFVSQQEARPGWPRGAPLGRSSTSDRKVFSASPPKTCYPWLNVVIWNTLDGRKLFTTVGILVQLDFNWFCCFLPEPRCRVCETLTSPRRLTGRGISPSQGKSSGFWKRRKTTRPEQTTTMPRRPPLRNWPRSPSTRCVHLCDSYPLLHDVVSLIHSVPNSALVWLLFRKGGA